MTSRVKSPTRRSPTAPSVNTPTRQPEPHPATRTRPKPPTRTKANTHTRPAPKSTPRPPQSKPAKQTPSKPAPANQPRHTKPPQARQATKTPAKPDRCTKTPSTARQVHPHPQRNQTGAPRPPAKPDGYTNTPSGARQAHPHTQRSQTGAPTRPSQPREQGQGAAAPGGVQGAEPLGGGLGVRPPETMDETEEKAQAPKERGPSRRWRCRELNPGPLAYRQDFSVRSPLRLYSAPSITRTS